MKIALTRNQYYYIMSEYQKRYYARHKTKIFSYYLSASFKEENNCDVKFIREVSKRGDIIERYEILFDREEDYAWFKLKWM